MAAQVDRTHVIAVCNLVQIGLREMFKMPTLCVVQHANGATEAVGPLGLQGHRYLT